MRTADDVKCLSVKALKALLETLHEDKFICVNTVGNLMILDADATTYLGYINMLEGSVELNS